MCYKVIICVFMIVPFESVTAQYDGNFWWLNKKLSDYREIPSAPKIEQLTEFDTDDSDRIVFRDDTYTTDVDKKLNFRDKVKTGNEIPSSEKIVFEIKFQDKSKFVWPDHKKEDVTEHVSFSKYNDSKKANSEDDFEFKFFDKNGFAQENTVLSAANKTINKIKDKNKNNKFLSLDFINNKKPMKVEEAEKESENVCTIMTKYDCNSVRGIVYVKHKTYSERPIFETTLICCILPSPNEDQSKIYFRDNSSELKRFKRSEKGTSRDLNQRLALLLRRFGSSKVKTSSVKNKHDQRIITPEDDDYVDPYWNIKTSNLKGPTRQNNRKTANKDCDDYVEDYTYTDELPQPGLVGLYSDHGSWTNGGENDNVGSGSPYGDFVGDEEDDYGTSFSYGATIDPRLDHLSAKPTILGRPVKISTSSKEYTYDADSQTINYQANPDFHVLQGFKLLNLVRNKSKIFRGKKMTSTESVYDDSDSKEGVLIASSFESGYDDSGNNVQVYQNCGRRAKIEEDSYEQGKETGETVKGSHPWLGLVVLTKRNLKFQCYATIVHPKAAVTAAECVHGKSPGDLSLIAGVWDLKEESRENWQRRMVSFHEHSKYRTDVVASNLAVLHWKRPLRLNANVQPVCLSDHQVGDECKFFGWGGYDQAIHRRSRWQTAMILKPRVCNERLPSLQQSLSSEAFCASVQSRGTVTGVGGSLICEAGSRQTAVGVAVWRDDFVVLVPAQHWIRDTLDTLGLL